MMDFNLDFKDWRFTVKDLSLKEVGDNDPFFMIGDPWFRQYIGNDEQPEILTRLSVLPPNYPPHIAEVVGLKDEDWKSNVLTYMRSRVMSTVPFKMKYALNDVEHKQCFLRGLRTHVMARLPDKVYDVTNEESRTKAGLADTSIGGYKLQPHHAALLKAGDKFVSWLPLLHAFSPGKLSAAWFEAQDGSRFTPESVFDMHREAQHTVNSDDSRWIAVRDMAPRARSRVCARVMGIKRCKLLEHDTRFIRMWVPIVQRAIKPTIVFGRMWLPGSIFDSIEFGAVPEMIVKIELDDEPTETESIFDGSSAQLPTEELIDRLSKTTAAHLPDEGLDGSIKSFIFGPRGQVRPGLVKNRDEYASRILTPLESHCAPTIISGGKVWMTS